jgi:arylsulfatase A-like enzyme
MIRWPGHITGGSVSNEIVSGLDWFPTLLAAAGDATIKDRLLKGADIGGAAFKVHLDGYDQLPYLTGREPKSARNSFFYFNDDGDLVGLRYDNWKMVFEEQRSPGTMELWIEPFTKLRGVKIFDLHADPFERADITSNTYWDWMMNHAYIIYGSQAYVAKFLDTFKEFPPSQRAATFTIDQAMDKLKQNLGD